MCSRLQQKKITKVKKDILLSPLAKCIHWGQQWLKCCTVLFQCPFYLLYFSRLQYQCTEGCIEKYICLSGQKDLTSWLTRVTLLQGSNLPFLKSYHIIFQSLRKTALLKSTPWSNNDRQIFFCDWWLLKKYTGRFVANKSCYVTFQDPLLWWPHPNSRGRRGILHCFGKWPKLWVSKGKEP